MTGLRKRRVAELIPTVCSFRELHRTGRRRSALAAQCALNAWPIPLDNQIEFGVWGGMTERERRALLRRRPDVRSWRTLLETARLEHTRGDVVTIPAQQVTADLRTPRSIFVPAPLWPEGIPKAPPHRVSKPRRWGYPPVFDSGNPNTTGFANYAGTGQADGTTGSRVLGDLAQAV